MAEANFKFYYTWEKGGGGGTNMMIAHHTIAAVSPLHNLISHDCNESSLYCIASGHSRIRMEKNRIVAITISKSVASYCETIETNQRPFSGKRNKIKQTAII